jgi:SSS family solute:Na+ symporter
MAEETWIYWTIFAAYLGYLVFSGYRSKQKTKTLTDYLVAGRSIGPILLGLSFGATYFSAVMIVGGGSTSYNAGLSTVWIACIDGVVGVFLIYVLFSRRTRSLSKKLNALTLPEFLGKRYQSGALQSFTGWNALILETIYLVSVFMGLAVLISIIMPGVTYAYPIACVICAIITIIYITMGGSYASIYTDVFESLLMLVGVLFIFIAGLMAVGGIDGLNDTLYSINPGLTEFPGLGGFAVVGSCLSTSFAIWGNPAMISRYFTAKNKRSLKWGLVVSLVWCFIVGYISWINGSIGRAYYEIYHDSVDLTGWTYITNIPMLMMNTLSPWLAALFIAAITAASLTTGEKLVLVGTAALARDIYQRKTGADDQKTMKVTKIATVFMVAIAAFLGMFNIAGVLDLCMWSFDIMCAVFMIPYVFGLYWKKGTAKAAIIAGAVGETVAVLWWIFFSTKSSMLGNLFGNPTLFPLFGHAGQIGTWTLLNIGGMIITLGNTATIIPSQLVVIVLFIIISKKTTPPTKEFIDEIFTFMEDESLSEYEEAREAAELVTQTATNVAKT